MVHGGLCLSHLEDGAAVFVAAAVPGELVRARIEHRRKKAWFATAIEALEPSPHRVAAPCPYFGSCGGCQLQHIVYAHQLVLKEGIVRDAMRRQGVVLPDQVGVHGCADPWRYRWRGEFHVVPGRDGLADARLGFNRARSWRPIPIDDCLIHHPRIAESIAGLEEVVRRSADERLTVLHLTAGEDGEELLIRGKPADALPATALDEAVGRGELSRVSTEATTLRWRDHVVRVTPETFIQVNWGEIETLYGLALAAAGDLTGKRVIDAYAGAGVLALEMARGAAEVVCIESNPHAVQMGHLNVRLAGAEDRIRFVPDAVERVLAAEAAGSDVVILDPPRAGCEGDVTAWLALAGPPRLVYVSCDPATLARDLRILSGSGPYRVESLDVVDMFPQTHHVECVVGLSRPPIGEV